MNKRVTIKEVAAASNVSVAVVSTVLNGKIGKIRVSEEKRSFIMETAKKLGYVPDISAQKLKTGDNHLIATFTYENIFPVESKTEFYDFFVGVQEEAAKEGYDLIILNNWAKGADRTSRLLIADGAIMIGVNKNSMHLASLIKQNFPLVFIGRREIEGITTPLNYVFFDYYNAIDSIIDNLKPFLDQKSLCYIHSNDNSEHFQDKHSALLQVCHNNTINIDEITYEPDNEENILNMIKRHNVIILDRLYMLPFFKELFSKNNLKCGENIFGAVLEDDWLGINDEWTSWENRRRELGALAVKNLVNTLNGNETGIEKSVKLDLVIRKSSRH